jgi:hypothetical protein
MALHYRRADAADYVHIDDPDTVRGDMPPVAGGWLPAAGQPAGCTRVTVRPLDAFEFAEFGGAATSAERLSAAWCGVVFIDGAKTPIAAVTPDLAHAIVALVASISVGQAAIAAGPLDRSE